MDKTGKMTRKMPDCARSAAECPDGETTFPRAGPQGQTARNLLITPVSG